MAAAIRKIASDTDKATDENGNKYFAKTEDWTQYQEQQRDLMKKAMDAYGKYKNDALNLRDDMVRRLGRSQDPQMGFTYMKPVNLLGIKDVANDLETLSSNLPLPTK
ncbi:MAG: hypothetical protein WAM96_17315 [Candidatus Acidiferrales bacterium]